MSEPAVVSMCSLGIGCRYHGKTVVMGYSIFKEKRIRALQQRYHLIPVCPEQLGGMPTPRPACDVVETPDGPKVVSREGGVDYTANYLRGARETLRICEVCGARRAYLYPRSPSCDPTKGITARMLREAGIKVMAL